MASCWHGDVQEIEHVDVPSDRGHARRMVGLLWGTFVGLVVGGGLSALSVYGLHVPVDQPLSAIWAYLFACAGGVLVGLFAGKPIWAKGARIEAGLKAAFGALLGAALMFALRKWIGFGADLSSMGLGSGAIGTSPVLSLPIVATVMALLFEVDNMFGGDDKEGGGRKRIVQSTGKRVSDQEPAEQEAEAGADKRKAKG
jgi:hypothetical protein